MTNKFESAADISRTDPRFRLMEAWADINGLLGNEPVTLGDAFLVQEQLQLERDYPGSIVPLDDELIFKTYSGELSQSLLNFQRAIEQMKGWSVTYSVLYRELGLLTLSHSTPLAEDELLDQIMVTEQGDWVGYEGILRAGATGPSLPKLGGMSVGLIVKEKDNTEYYLAMNAIHTVTFHESGEYYERPEHPLDRMQQLYSHDDHEATS